MGIVARSKPLLRIAQDQRVPLDGSLDIYRNDGDGFSEPVTFDAAHKVNTRPIDAWPDGEGKIGDSLGPDGSGPDGYGHGGVGDGLGADGIGMDGFGAQYIPYVGGLLDDGDYVFAVVARDPAGNPAAPSSGTEVTLALAGTPKPPASIAAASWDNGAGELTLTLGLSPSDEAA